MNNCGTSPLFIPTTYIPTTVNCQIKNLDAVDVAATNISCETLSIAGEPVSTVLQNLGESLPNETVFIGDVEAGSFTTSGTITTGSLTSTTTNAGVLTTSSITNAGSIATLSLGATTLVASGDVSGATLTGTLATATQNNVTKIGTQTSFASSGSISQTGGTATLKATTVDSLSTAGNITQSSTGVATLKATTVDSLSTAGNITQTGTGTSTLRGTTVTSLTSTGSIICPAVTSSEDLECIGVGNTSTTPTFYAWADGVGIGTNDPIEKLHVVGNTKVTGGITTTYVTASGDITATGVITGTTGTFSGGITGTTGTFSGNVGTTGNMTCATIKSTAKAIVALSLSSGVTQSIPNTTWTALKYLSIYTGLDVSTSLSSGTAGSSTAVYGNTTVGVGYTASTGLFQNTSGYGRIFSVSGAVQFSTNANGFRGVRINTGTTTSVATCLNTDIRNTVSGTSAYLNFSHVFFVANNAYFQIQVYQSSGAALNIESAVNDLTSLSVSSVN